MVAVAWLINFLMLQDRPFSMVLCYDEEWFIFIYSDLVAEKTNHLYRGF